MRRSAPLIALAIAISVSGLCVGEATVQAQPACAALNATLPAEFIGWTTKSDITAAAKADEANTQVATEGTAFHVALRPISDVNWVSPPGHPATAGSFGGMLTLNVGTAGTYVVAADAGAWLDVLSEGKTISSSAHGHGPECSTIHKQVAFTLEPGRYVLQISSAPDASIGVMFARKP
jgi:hypothetical protein